MKVRNGKLVKTERDIERYARDWVERVHRGLYVETKAEHVKRNGAPAFERGTLDAIGIIPAARIFRNAFIADDLYSYLIIFFEWKADRARTKRSHLAEQTSTAAKLRRDGYLVYQAPEDCEDVIGHFHEWVREQGL
jgi:hypothetical protein